MFFSDCFLWVSFVASITFCKLPNIKGCSLGCWWLLTWFGLQTFSRKLWLLLPCKRTWGHRSKILPTTFRSFTHCQQGLSSQESLFWLQVWLRHQQAVCYWASNYPSLGFCTVGETRGSADPSSRDISHFSSSALPSNNFHLNSIRSDRRGKKNPVRSHCS